MELFICTLIPALPRKMTVQALSQDTPAPQPQPNLTIPARPRPNKPQRAPKSRGASSAERRAEEVFQPVRRFVAEEACSSPQDHVSLVFPFLCLRLCCRNLRMPTARGGAQGQTAAGSVRCLGRPRDLHQLTFCVCPKVIIRGLVTGGKNNCAISLVSGDLWRDREKKTC